MNLQNLVRQRDYTTRTPNNMGGTPRPTPKQSDPKPKVTPLISSRASLLFGYLSERQAFY